LLACFNWRSSVTITEFWRFFFGFSSALLWTDLIHKAACRTLVIEQEIWVCIFFVIKGRWPLFMSSFILYFFKVWIRYYFISRQIHWYLMNFTSERAAKNVVIVRSLVIRYHFILFFRRQRLLLHCVHRRINKRLSVLVKDLDVVLTNIHIRISHTSLSANLYRLIIIFLRCILQVLFQILAKWAYFRNCSFYRTNFLVCIKRIVINFLLFPDNQVSSESCFVNNLLKQRFLGIIFIRTA